MKPVFVAYVFRFTLLFVSQVYIHLCMYIVVLVPTGPIVVHNRNRVTDSITAYAINYTRFLQWLQVVLRIVGLPSHDSPDYT